MNTVEATAAVKGRVDEVLSRYEPRRESLIPVLQGVQEIEGYLPKASIHRIADYLGLPESKIYGVATFYNQFKLNPPGRYQIQVCRGTACHVKGSSEMIDSLIRQLGIAPGETTRDGMFSLETVACLGACSIAPVITVNGEFHGRLDKKKIVAVLEQIRAEEAADA